MNYIERLSEPLLDYTYPLPRYAMLGIFRGTVGRIVDVILDHEHGSRFPYSNENKFTKLEFDQHPVLYQKVISLSLKMGLDLPQIFLILTTPHAESDFSSNSDKKNPQISIPTIYAKNYPLLHKSQVDFSVAHELAHAFHDHRKQLSLFKSAALVSDLCAFFLFGVSGPLILETCFFTPLEDYIYRKQESEADETAIKILNSSEGAIETFQSEIEMNQRGLPKGFIGDLTNTLISLGKNLYPRPKATEIINQLKDLASKALVKLTYSSKGNRRDDHEHPLLTQRLEAAKSFRPV